MNYRANSVWRFQQPTGPSPARHMRVAGDKLVVRVKFAPAGVSQCSNEVLGLIRCGIINAASTGFAPLESYSTSSPHSTEQKVLRWELQKMSVC
jgi:hypothetical protein